MSRARQVANFDPALFAADEVSGDKVSGGTIGAGTIGGSTVVNTSGAITTTGAFTSVGIDDNASGAVAITIDANENVGIGTTAIGTSSHNFTGEHNLTLGGATANSFSILEIAGNDADDNAYIGGIEFVNKNNSDAAGGTAEGVAAIVTKVETDDTNAGDDSGGHLTFWTKGNGSNLGERYSIDSSGNLILGATATQKVGHWYQIYTLTGASSSSYTTGLSGHRLWVTFKSGGNKRADVVMYNGRLNPGSWTGNGFIIGHGAPSFFSGSTNVSDANNNYYISVSGGTNQITFGRNSGSVDWDLHVKAFKNSN